MSKAIISNLPIHRSCRECGKNYDHSPIMVGDVDLMAGVFRCFHCSEKKELADKEAERTEKARSEYLRIVPKTYRETSIAHESYPIAAHNHGQKWAAGHRPSEFFWFGIIGEHGQGKTRVLSQVLRRLLWQGNVGEWVTSTEFGDKVDALFCADNGRDARWWLRRYKKAGVLVFDDLGKQVWNARMCAQFFNLLEYRNARALPLLWSSNYGLDELGEDIPEKQRGAIIDRLEGNSLIVKLS